MPQISKFCALLFLCFLFGIVASAPGPPRRPGNLYPISADGFDTVYLDDMSWITAMTFKEYSPNNITCYIYGNFRIRTLYAASPINESFYVGPPPQNMRIPFLDFQVIQNGPDMWAMGPTNPFYQENDPTGYHIRIALVSTKPLPNDPRDRIFLLQNIGLGTAFFSFLIANYSSDNVVGYFCGFFPSDSSDLNFGIRRAHFNVSLLNYVPENITDVEAWTYNPIFDDAVIFSDAQLVAYNANYKPFVLPVYNMPNSAPNSVWIVVVDPYTELLALISASTDPTIPLDTDIDIIHSSGNYVSTTIVSAVTVNHTLFVGLSVDGQGAGRIAVIDLANRTLENLQIYLPANFSSPRVLLFDSFAPRPTLYVGMNGGYAILRIDVATLSITGYQTLPYYLQASWTGQVTQDYVYFASNEQHAKVFRVSKDDFCPFLCERYCLKGKCI